MMTEVVRAAPEWLALREAADARARARDLVPLLRPLMPSHGVSLVYDLGGGTGAMARWLAPQLDGPQHWVEVDRDAGLLGLVDAQPAPVAGDGAPVTFETVCGDITRMVPGELQGASLVTASAVLDMLTGAELDRLVATCGGAACPVLVVLSVVGRVELAPADPLDRRVAEAFDADQRRETGGGRLLGPDGFDAAVAGFARQGRRVVVRPSPWVLGAGDARDARDAGHADDARLAREWFTGWLDAACQQRPELGPATRAYRQRRLAELDAARLRVVVHHRDLLALP